MADFEDFDWLRNITTPDDIRRVFYRIKDFDKENDTVNIEQPDGSIKTYSMKDEEEKAAEGEEKTAEGEDKTKKSEDKTAKEDAEKEGEEEKSDDEKKTDWEGIKTEVDHYVHQSVVVQNMTMFLLVS